MNNQLVQPVPNVPFILDGRWLHAFNGPGMGTQSTAVTINYGNYANLTLNVPNSTYGNFRYNGLDPNAVGMDEDYDACDLENWFLAIQSADGQVIIPSFHRPGIVRYQDAAHPMDWDGTSGGFRYPNGTLGMPNLDSVARILRPVAADGHDAATFPDLVPDPNTGKITYDVDNDGGRGQRLGLARPGLPGPPRRQRQPVQAALRLHGDRVEWPHPAQHRREPRRGRRHPRPAPREFGERNRPDLRAPERPPPRPGGRPVQRHRQRCAAAHRQHAGRQRRDRRSPDSTPQLAGRHSASDPIHCWRPTRP